MEVPGATDASDAQIPRLANHAQGACDSLSQGRQSNCATSDRGLRRSAGAGGHRGHSGDDNAVRFEVRVGGRDIRQARAADQ